MVVPAGTRIDIGDGNVIDVLRLQPAGSADERNVMTGIGARRDRQDARGSRQR